MSVARSTLATNWNRITDRSICRGFTQCPALRRNIHRGLVKPFAAAPDKAVSLPYPAKPDMSTSLTECSMSTVMVDNQAHPLYTQLFIEAPDTPGLLRVLSWVLNGMNVRVQHATLGASEVGTARNTLWVTDFRGRKLKDASADCLVSRVEDFLIVCGTELKEEQREWRCGSIEVSNAAHPDMTQVIVRGEPSGCKQGFLLELSTALTDVGATVVSGAIQGGADAPAPDCAVADPDYDFRRGRYFKFLLKGPTGGQMDKDRVSCLIFTLRLLQGKTSMPTVAPNMDALLEMNTIC